MKKFTNLSISIALLFLSIIYFQITFGATKIQFKVITESQKSFVNSKIANYNIQRLQSVLGKIDILLGKSSLSEKNKNLLSDLKVILQEKLNSTNTPQITQTPINTGATVLSNSTYPGCDTPDIKLSNGQVWSACNVGTTTAGKESISYGKYYTYSEALNICPSGYKLPSKTDWESAYSSYQDQDLTSLSNLANKLMLPLAGDNYEGLNGQNDFGIYWSSTQYNSTNAYDLSFFRVYFYPASGYTNSEAGLSVRCLKLQKKLNLKNTPKITQTPINTNTGVTTTLNSNYPGCDTPDIKLSNGQVWSACNVGTTTAGTGESSYGKYYTYSEALNICPSGYKLPSKTDWKTAFISYKDQDITSLSNLPNKLMLPLASYSDGIDGHSGNGGYDGHYWTSTPYGNLTAYEFNFLSSGVFYNGEMYRSFHFSVRCLKN